ncbi:hypothetical protein V492_03066 [Pseudogymnoascus sp. VKM F-4246]|nr:hypothetical protein V492_03066 [Pseudogymnoascus sp. VKM F-4246]
MHQHPRPPPQGSSPASSPSTNPYRTNNPREGGQSGHSRFGSDAPQYSESESTGMRADNVAPSSGPSAEARRKLDQIVQNFHTKAATVILQSRMSFPTIRTKDQTTKVNKWFQLETDDTDAFREDLRLWKTCGGFENRPPPLILETYLDTSDLSNKQSLVIVDDNGKHWDVAEALNEAQGLKHSESRHRKRHTEVILERWRIELKEGSTDETFDYGAILPTIYKKAIVFFRTLYATARFTPVSKFVKSIGKVPSSRGGLKINCRIINGESFVPAHHDPLTIPLFQGDGETTTRFNLGETESPAGPFSAEVCYRNDCNFRAADSEALLSERFMGAEDFFQPTLASRREDRRRDTRATEVGSLPVNRRFSVDVEPTQTYGSLSTFHGEGPTLAASPISALRAARNMASETNSPPAGSSYAKYAQPSRPTSRANEGLAAARRPSVSFNPFKAGSLSGSPLPGTSAPQQGEMLPPGSSQSVPRTVGMSALSQPRNRSSLTAGMPASLRGIPVQQDNNTISPSGSPKTVTINRYSSSFSHRRGRLSYGGTSRAEDDQGSSGKQSLSSSSAQPGSGILAEATAGSSGSIQTDDDNISDFLSVLESNKNLPSFQQRGNEAATRRTAAQLTRFQSMKESHNILTESLTSSMLLHRSSSSSSRQLSSVPPMVAATSISTSSSPGKPISPHTPHTPAIPSRLSANSIVEYPPPGRERRRSAAEEDRIDDVSGDEDDNGPGTTAIDIPLSPRPRQYPNRRSSSVAQEQRTLAVDDDENDLPFHRSISLGADDREPPSLSDLRGFGQLPGTVPEETRDRSSQTAPGIGSAAMDGQLSGLDSVSPPVPRSSAQGSQHLTRRPKVDRSSLSAQTGSSSSDVVITRRAGSGERDRTNRYSFSRPIGPPFDDDEYPLLFDMSEIGRNSEQSRRSLEDNREGAGGASSERDSGGGSRRGSHRGW